MLNLLKMANLTAHVEKEINLVDKCPFIEKANCNEGLVRLICDGHSVTPYIEIDFRSSRCSWNQFQR